MKMVNVRVDMRIAVLALLMAIAPSLCSAEEGGALLFEEPWAKWQEDGSIAVHVVINNRTSIPVTLEDVSSSVASSVELVASDGGSTRRVVTIPIHAELYMFPDSMHVEMRDLTIEPGVDTVPLELQFLGEQRVSLDVPVLPADALPPDHQDFKHGPGS